MKRLLICLMLSGCCSVVDAQVRSGTYRASNGRTYNWCPAGQCEMCDREWAARYGNGQQSAWSYQWSTQTTTVPAVTASAVEYEMVPERYQSGTQKICINGVCSYQPIYSTRMVQRARPASVVPAVTGRQAKTEPAATGQPRRTGQSATTDADQGQSSPEQITAMLDAMDLTANSRLLEIGCGPTASVCIAAVERSGCYVIGVEREADVAAKARRAVAAAEKSGRITPGRVLILTADAADIDPAAYGITHGYAYLWPDDLERLSGVMSQIPVVVSLNHPVPGRTATRTVGSVYVYERTPARPVVAPIVRQPTQRNSGFRIVN